MQLPPSPYATAYVRPCRHRPTAQPSLRRESPARTGEQSVSSAVRKDHGRNGGVQDGDKTECRQQQLCRGEKAVAILLGAFLMRGRIAFDAHLCPGDVGG